MEYMIIKEKLKLLVILVLDESHCSMWSSKLIVKIKHLLVLTVDQT